MNKILFFIFMIFLMIACGKQLENEKISDNPLMTEFKTPFEVPDFENIKTDHYLPAIKAGMDIQKKEISEIINNQEKPDFNNTIEALDYSGGLLKNTTGIFYNLLSANTSPELQELARTLSPILSKHHDEILMDPALYARINAVYRQVEDFNLVTEQEKLVEKYHKRFIRNGANLSPEQKEILKKINEELSLLGLQFGDNLLAEDNQWKLEIENQEDLAGLPEMVISAASSAASDAGLGGKWIITLHKPSWIPFLQYSSRRDLREKVFRAWMNRGNNKNEYDNNKIIQKTLTLRNQKAELLGFKDWAAYILDENMAGNSKAVYELLNGLWGKALPIAEMEATDMQKMIDQENESFQLEPWDWWYYAEKVRKARYDLDDETLRPYFELNNVRNGLFHVVNKLYGLDFIERPDLPRPHPDAKCFEVLENDGSHVGILYMDFYPRASKTGGAWMDAYRKQYRENGRNFTPVITTVFNFTAPAGDQPALLTFDEVETMFHEMGHALHGLLSDCNYRTLSGTAVPRDFVELPSQILENWAAEPEVLKHYARHIQTGEVIPDELILKLSSSNKFNRGFATVEYLAASLLDMAYHTASDPENIDPNAFEKEAMKKIRLIPQIIPRYRSTFFKHIFEGEGYSAGYYSYKWAEVIDADAYEAFTETGDIFNPHVASSFRKNILSKGGTDDAMKLYVNFRGKEPNLNPLLKRSGLM
ncbi:MAG: M3 family metallopeptidase [Cyclobacteriaceae bacterium]|nr:M3 family metallopeptidase [Cyclobacteriaceae bacterium]